jgi:hypothetical protein
VWAGAALNLSPSYSGMLAAQKFQFTRGFVSEVRCTGEEWASGCYGVTWRPGWKRQCPRCDGAGYIRYYHPVEIEGVDDCQECDEGYVPVPWPTGRSPQPVETVRLTTRPGGGLFPQLDPDRVGGSFRSWRWPGIEFLHP